MWKWPVLGTVGSGYLLHRQMVGLRKFRARETPALVLPRVHVCGLRPVSVSHPVRLIAGMGRAERRLLRLRLGYRTIGKILLFRLNNW